MAVTLLLKSTDLEATKVFYRQRLGFSVFDSEQGTCTVCKDDVTIVFSDAELWQGAPHCTGTFYFFLSDVDDYFGSVKEKVNLLWPLEHTSYGTKDFGIKDCNGYTLAFASKR